jgi:hypothetical protein
MWLCIFRLVAMAVVEDLKHSKSCRSEQKILKIVFQKVSENFGFIFFAKTRVYWPIVALSKT